MEDDTKRLKSATTADQIRTLGIEVHQANLEAMGGNLQGLVKLVEAITAEADAAHAGLSLADPERRPGRQKPSPFGDRELPEIKAMHERLDGWHQSVHDQLTHITEMLRATAITIGWVGGLHIREERERAERLGAAFDPLWTEFGPRGGRDD
jgi:hypothetical protein